MEEDELGFYFNLNWDEKNWLLNRLRVLNNIAIAHECFIP